MLLTVAFSLGGCAAPYFAAQKVIVPELLGEDEKRVSEATALFQAATRVTLLLGPALAGVLIGVIGATSVLVVDASTYVISLVLVAVFVPQRPPIPQEKEDRSVKRRDPVHRSSDRLLRVWAPIFALGDAAWNAFFVAVPVLVLERFGHHPQIAGWLFAAFGVGAVLGNVIIVSLAHGPLRRTEPDLGLRHGAGAAALAVVDAGSARLCSRRRSACQGSRTASSTRACTRSRCCASRLRCGRT